MSKLLPLVILLSGCAAQPGATDLLTESTASQRRCTSATQITRACPNVTSIEWSMGCAVAFRCNGKKIRVPR